jgi:hypothetical protein
MVDPACADLRLLRGQAKRATASLGFDDGGHATRLQAKQLGSIGSTTYPVAVKP